MPDEDDDELPDETVVLPEPEDLDEDLLEPFELLDLVVFVLVVLVLEFELLLSADASLDPLLSEPDPELSED